MGRSCWEYCRLGFRELGIVKKGLHRRGLHSGAEYPAGIVKVEHRSTVHLRQHFLPQSGHLGFTAQRQSYDSSTITSSIAKIPPAQVQIRNTKLS